MFLTQSSHLTESGKFTFTVRSDRLFQSFYAPSLSCFRVNETKWYENNSIELAVTELANVSSRNFMQLIIIRTINFVYNTKLFILAPCTKSIVSIYKHIKYTQPSLELESQIDNGNLHLINTISLDEIIWFSFRSWIWFGSFSYFS